jgi:hypothetical protein
MKLAKLCLNQAEKLLESIHENSPVDVRIEKARILTEAAKAEAMIEIGRELHDICLALEGLRRR